MLNPKEIAALLAILSDDTRPLEALSAHYVRVFPRPNLYRASCGLQMLLQANMLSTPQRVVALVLLYDAYKLEHAAITANPFLPVFTETLVAKSSFPAERVLAHLILTIAPRTDLPVRRPGCPRSRRDTNLH